MSAVRRVLRKPRASAPSIRNAARLVKMPAEKGSMFMRVASLPRHIYVRRGAQSRNAMAFTADIILKGGALVNHDGVGRRDVAISGGRIAGIGSFGPGQAGEVIDCRGLHILP